MTLCTCLPLLGCHGCCWWERSRSKLSHSSGKQWSTAYSWGLFEWHKPGLVMHRSQRSDDKGRRTSGTVRSFPGTRGSVKEWYSIWHKTAHIKTYSAALIINTDPHNFCDISWQRCKHTYTEKLLSIILCSCLPHFLHILFRLTHSSKCLFLWNDRLISEEQCLLAWRVFFFSPTHSTVKSS